MANVKNLKSNYERTPKERKELARKAGIASGIARLEKKSAREYAEMALNVEIMDEVTGEKVTAKNKIILNMVRDAIKENDLQKVKYLFELVDESPTQKMDVTTNGKDIGTQLVFSPTPLSEKDIQEIKDIQNGNKEDSNDTGLSEA